jgi:hypothetical protein
MLGKDEIGLGRGKGTGDTTGMLRKNTTQIDIDEELCACFIDWQNVFDRLSWTELMQVLHGIGIDWRERRLSANCAWMRVLGDKNFEHWERV